MSALALKADISRYRAHAALSRAPRAAGLCMIEGLLNVSAMAMRAPSSLVESGQFVVVENIDLPKRISEFANVETFTSDPNVGRAGLFLSQ